MCAPASRAFLEHRDRERLAALRLLQLRQPSAADSPAGTRADDQDIDFEGVAGHELIIEVLKVLEVLRVLTVLVLEVLRVLKVLVLKVLKVLALETRASTLSTT